MRLRLEILMAILGIMLFSCSAPEVTSDTISAKKEGHNKYTSDDSKATKSSAEEEKMLDSMRLQGVLNQALQRVKSRSLTVSFSESFQSFPDRLYTVDSKIDYGFHFSDKQRHLIIRRYSPGLVQIDIFSVNDTVLDHILSHEQWATEYLNDTIRDVNGDGLKDLIVNCYGSTGCCLKAFSCVYLSRSDRQSFSTMYDFLNPTFSDHDGVIRGLCYGHRGKTELYTFKWMGEKIDTIEYISFEKDNNGRRTGKVIISNQYPTHKNYKIIRKVNRVPKVYERIEGYDWFYEEK